MNSPQKDGFCIEKKKNRTTDPLSTGRFQTMDRTGRHIGIYRENEIILRTTHIGTTACDFLGVGKRERGREANGKREIADGRDSSRPSSQRRQAQMT